MSTSAVRRRQAPLLLLCAALLRLKPEAAALLVTLLTHPTGPIGTPHLVPRVSDVLVILGPDLASATSGTPRAKLTLPPLLIRFDTILPLHIAIPPFVIPAPWLLAQELGRSSVPARGSLRARSSCSRYDGTFGTPPACARCSVHVRMLGRYGAHL
ncbi:hypothetical protein K438DRAFT_1969661 [Mycena galopus ATCC 62051]|nr:hypothetical protein K438DRAFT_1969661 [Mycena galopus ATCC 62051]